MELDRRNLIALAAAAGPLSITQGAQAAPAGNAPAAGGIDAAHYGLRPGNPEDQSRILQHAIDETARARKLAEARRKNAVEPGAVFLGGDVQCLAA